MILRFILLICLTLFPFSTMQCEEYPITEQYSTPTLHIWGGNKNDYLLDTYRTHNGGFVLLAQTNSTNGTPVLSTRTESGKKDGWILQIAQTGEFISERLLADDGNNNTTILGGAETPEGAYIVIIESSENETSPVVHKSYVVQYNDSDKSIKKEQLPGIPHEVYASDHGILLVGACSTSPSRSVAWSAFIETSGQLSWSYCSPEDYGYSQKQIRFENCVLRQDQSILVMEKTIEDSNMQYLRILDQRGQFLRDILLPSQDYLYIRGLLPTDEGLLLFGYTFSDTLDTQGFFLHIDLNGNRLFSKKVDDIRIVNAVCPAAQGGYYFAENTSDGINVFHISNAGEVELQQSYAYSQGITCQSISEEPDGSISCAGTLRIQSPDNMVTEKLFVLQIPQRNLFYYSYIVLN